MGDTRTIKVCPGCKTSRIYKRSPAYGFYCRKCKAVYKELLVVEMPGKKVD